MSDLEYWEREELARNHSEKIGEIHTDAGSVVLWTCLVCHSVVEGGSLLAHYELHQGGES